MNYRGDTFIRNYSVEIDDEIYTFQSGDILKTAFIDKTGRICLEKTINLTEGDTDIDVVWTATEMATLQLTGNIDPYIIETEIVTNSWTKTIQEKVKISLDYIVEN